MAKQKLTKEERALKRAETIYEECKEQFNLHGDNDEQISQLIDMCCDIQCEICSKSDEIKINNFDKAEELIRIDKPTWMEFVNMTAKKYYGRLNDKAVDKYEEMCDNKRYIANLKQSFYDTYLTDNTLKVIDENESASYDFDNEENREFQTLMEDSAKIRDYINNSLYKRYKSIYMCAFYLSEGALKYADFKDLVDWRYYENSTDEKYPDRAKKIFEKFDRFIRLTNKYSGERGAAQLGELCSEYGLTYDLHTPQGNKNMLD